VATSAYIHDGETVDTEPVIPSVVAAETIVWNSVAFVTAALLPTAMFRLPTMSAITLPSDSLYACLFRTPMLCGPVVLLLMLLASGLLLLLFCSVFALLTLFLPLLILLPFGLLLLLFRSAVLLLTPGLPLLILLPSGLLLLLFRSVFALLTLFLPLLILLPSGLLLALSCRLVLLLLFGFWLLLLLCWLCLLFLFILLRVGGRNHPKKQKECGCTHDSNSFHGVTLQCVDSCARHSRFRTPPTRPTLATSCRAPGLVR